MEKREFDEQKSNFYIDGSQTSRLNDVFRQTSPPERICALKYWLSGQYTHNFNMYRFFVFTTVPSVPGAPVFKKSSSHRSVRIVPE